MVFPGKERAGKRCRRQGWGKLVKNIGFLWPEIKVGTPVLGGEGGEFKETGGGNEANFALAEMKGNCAHDCLS